MFYGNTVEEIINTIFEDTLTIRDFKKPRGFKESYGYYVELQHRSNEQIRNLDLIQKLFYSCNKLAFNRIQGINSETDSENTFAQMLEYLFISFNAVFNGERNDKLSEQLQIYNVDDIHRILNDEILLDSLCAFIYREVDNRFKQLVYSKENADFYYDRTENKLEGIGYVFLDKENVDGKNNYDLIEKEEVDFRTGDLSKYLFNTYMEHLTKKQQQWCQAVILYDIQDDGSIINLDTNEILYTREQCKQFKTYIRKRIQKLIEEDVHIDISGSHWKYKR